MNRSMVLVRVLLAMRIDVRRSQFADGGLDDVDRLHPAGDARILEIAELKLCAEQLGRAICLDRALVDVTTGRPA